MGGGGKETPRQKMIGMMYLVLTALLAMNVSKNVLAAFVTIEEGLNETNRQTDAKNLHSYAVFDSELANDRKRAQKHYDNAQKVKKAADELCAFIDSCRGEVMFTLVAGNTDIIPSRDSADTWPLTDENLPGLDNYDIPTHILIGPPEKPNGLAIPMKQKIKEFRELCFNSVPDKEKKNLQIGLNVEDVWDNHYHDSIPWEISNFDHTTVAAALALLAGVKNEIKTAEADVVNILLSQLSGDIIRFDVVEPKVIASSNYVIAGSEYKADIFLAAYSTTQDPVIMVEGQDSALNVEGGMGKYVYKTGAPGEKYVKGVIKVKGPDGKFKEHEFADTFMVAKPSFAVSPTKMNVFYIGVDNPVEISVAGAAPNQISASLSPSSAGRITPKGGGKYVVKVKKGSKCQINVGVKKNGKVKPMGKAPFRIKPVPSPVASFAGVRGDGKVTRGKLKSAGGVIPKLDDFVFDLKFPVVSWVLSMNINGVFVDKKARGPAITPAMKQLLAKAKPGGKVLIEQVKVKAPDGKIRKISGCVIKVR